MSGDAQQNLERWEDLHVTRLLFGLSSEEQVEYEALARTMPAETGDEFERLIAKIDVAWADSKPLPAHLREAVRAKAIAEIKLARQQISLPAGVSRPPSRPMNWLPWTIAAACLVVSLVTFTANRNPILIPQDFAQMRANLLASAKDLIELKWADGPTPVAGAGGDVVWSHALQQGYMRFQGMPVNIAAEEQYQLWIFDQNQSEKTPIDGGVFDITSTGDVIVPIHAKLHVAKAYLFAVTIEKPGGVVVSSRDRLPLLAAVK